LHQLVLVNFILIFIIFGEIDVVHNKLFSSGTESKLTYQETSQSKNPSNN
jgi:hypothetical protein